MSSTTGKREFWRAVIGKASKEAVKQGLIKKDLPDNVADGLADQFAFAYELVSSGHVPTPGSLTSSLMEKFIGLAKIPQGSERYQCGVAASVVGVGLVKSAGALALAAADEGATGHVAMLEVAELMKSVYEADEKCGVSQTIKKEIDKRTLPAYMWLNDGIMQMLRSQSAGL